MNSPRRARRQGWKLARSAIPTVAIILLMGCVYLYHQEAQRLSERAEVLRVRAEARELRSALLGQELESSDLVRLRGGPADIREDGSGLRVLWFVNPKTCVGCLKSLAGWREVKAHPRVEARLILVGVSEEEARRLRSTVQYAGDAVRMREDTRIGPLPGEQVPPHLMLMLDRDGKVLAAEVGDRKTICQPDLFEDLISLVEAVRIRPETTLASAGDRIGEETE